MSGDLGQMIGGAFLVLVPMILSLTVHEFAHALAAKALGDDTAEQQGRLNLNPMSHIDPVGTVILPMVLLVFNIGFFFGWARPVPFNPSRFRRGVHPRTGATIVAAAGPVSNLILAALCFAIFAFFWHTDQSGALPEPVHVLISKMVTVNVSLAVFNLIPVHPLDGQKVLAGLLPTETAIAFERFSYQYGSWLILAVMFFGGRFIAVPFNLVLGGLAAVFGVPL